MYALTKYSEKGCRICMRIMKKTILGDVSTHTGIMVCVHVMLTRQYMLGSVLFGVVNPFLPLLFICVAGIHTFGFFFYNCFGAEAVSDANKAIELDRSNPKAYLRKGTACFNLEEYQTAKAAFEAGAALVPEDKRFGEWIKKCDKCIAEENGELSTPSLDATSAEVVAKTDAEPKDTEPVNNVTPAKPKYRHEFYQKPEEVVVTIFAKGIPAESVTVNYGEQILSVSIDVPGEEKYVFQPRLFGKIVPANCKYNILSTKIEIRLAKVEPIHWTSLEFNNNVVVARSSTISTGNRRPVYPSSKPTKDWDKLEAQVKKEEKDEKLDGDAALNKFFREIYSDADEDTRRAMSKSFVESNGTVLSTNWKEVGAKEVEGTPPDGMELKKWE